MSTENTTPLTPMTDIERLANIDSKAKLLLALMVPFAWVKVGDRWECNWVDWLLSVDNCGTDESGFYNDECRIYINDSKQVITQTYYEMRNSELRRQCEDMAIATRVRQTIRWNEI